MAINEVSNMSIICKCDVKFGMCSSIYSHIKRQDGNEASRKDPNKKHKKYIGTQLNCSSKYLFFILLCPMFHMAHTDVHDEDIS